MENFKLKKSELQYILMALIRAHSTESDSERNKSQILIGKIAKEIDRLEETEA